mgnify:FL=1
MVVYNAPVPFGRPRGNKFNINYEYNRPPNYVPYEQFVAALPGYEAYRKSDTSIPRAKGSDVWKDVVLPKVISFAVGKVFRAKTGGTEAEALADNEVAENWIKSATEKLVAAASPTQGTNLLNNLPSAASIMASVKAQRSVAAKNLNDQRNAAGTKALATAKEKEKKMFDDNKRWDKESLLVTPWGHRINYPDSVTTYEQRRAYLCKTHNSNCTDAERAALVPPTVDTSTPPVPLNPKPPPAAPPIPAPAPAPAPAPVVPPPIAALPQPPVVPALPPLAPPPAAPLAPPTGLPPPGLARMAARRRRGH